MSSIPDQAGSQRGGRLRSMPLTRIRTTPTASGVIVVQVIWQYVDNKPVLD